MADEEDEFDKEMEEALDGFMREVPDEVKALIESAASGDISEEEFLRVVFIGDCPSCSSSKTICCDETEGIEDPTVGMCEDCGFIWCTECGSPLVMGETCGHWEVCDACDEPRNEFGECDIDLDECPYILEWMEPSQSLTSIGCAWCDRDISSQEEVFAVGAKLKEGIEVVTGAGADDATLLNVMVGGRPVLAIVSAQGSEARSQGNDLLFMVCSKECAEELRAALENERDMIERASLN